jgi:gluconolactonase
MAYNVMDDGTLDSGRIFFDVTAETAPGSPDGLKVDQEGHVFATGPGGVWVLDPTGKHLGTIQPNEVPANVAWGNDGRTLYMTARTGLYRVALTTQGLMP